MEKDYSDRLLAEGKLLSELVVDLVKDPEWKDF